MRSRYASYLPNLTLMQPLAAIELLLLQERTQGTEFHLTPGRVLAARVVQPQTPVSLGKLAVAGMTLEASLPTHLRAGEEVHLSVRDVSAERLTLTIVPPALPEPPRVPLPGGGSVRVTEREAAGNRQDEVEIRALTLRYDAPNLGAVDLRFQLAPGGLQLSLRAAAGAPLEIMQSHLHELRALLQRDAPATVTAAPRRDLVRYA